MVWVKDRGKVWVDIRRRKDVRVCVWIMIEEMKKAKKERDEQCRWLLRTWTSDKFIIYFYHNKNKVYYYPSLSYPIVSYPILFSPILFYPLLSYPILSYLIPSKKHSPTTEKYVLMNWKLLQAMINTIYSTSDVESRLNGRHGRHFIHEKK